MILRSVLKVVGVVLGSTFVAGCLVVGAIAGLAWYSLRTDSDVRGWWE